MQTLTRPPAEPAAPGRIVAIDIARGIALLGMMLVHISFESQESFEWGHILGAPSGRAAVLFFMLSGLSLSVIARRGARSAQPSVLLKRGAVLLLAGIMMSGFFPATILSNYGAAFLAAPWLLRRSSRFLAGTAVLALLAGPVLVQMLGGNLTSWSYSNGYTPVTSWAIGTLAGLLFDSYPLAVWLGFFAIGMLVGRADLGRRSVLARLVALGVALVVISTISIQLTDHLMPPELDKKWSEKADVALSDEGKTFDSGEVWTLKADVAESDGMLESDEMLEWGEESKFEWSEPNWILLASGWPHANTTLWALQSSGIALALIGLIALAPAAATRPLRPLAALGSISLTAYVFHTFLVQDVWFWLGSIVPDGFAWELGRSAVLTMAMLGLGWIIKRHWNQGPLERLLNQLTGGTATPSSTREPERPIPVG